MALEDIGVRVLVLGLGEFRRSVGTVKGDIASVEATTRSVSGTMQGFGTTLTQIGGSMISLGRTMTLAITAPLGILSGVLVNSGLQFQDTFQGIARTEEGMAVGFNEIAAAAKSQLGITVTSMDEASAAAATLGMHFGDLTPLGAQVRDEFRKMALDVPLATDKITELGTTLATLGVSTGDIVETTRLVAMLGAAVDISAEEAATSLTKMFNILHTEGQSLPDFLNRAGSSIVELGNASVATNADILNLGLRLAAAGDRAKFTTPEILAWATTISDVGARAEAGGSAVSRAINEMIMAVQSGGDNLGTFAQVAGMSVAQFTKMFKEDASNAVLTFITAMNKGISTGKVTKDMLNDMGLGGIRAIDILGRLSNATEDFQKNLAVANDGWDRQVALQDVAQKRWNTASSMIQTLKNDFTDLGISIFDLVEGDIKNLISQVRNVVDWFKSLDDSSKKAMLRFALIAAAVGPLLVILGGLVSAFGTLITVVGALASPIGLVVVGVGLLVAALGDLIGWDNIFRAGEKALKDVQPLIDAFVNSLGLIPTKKTVEFNIAPGSNQTAAISAAQTTGVGTAPAGVEAGTVAAPVPETIKTLGDTIQEFIAKNQNLVQFFAAVQTAITVAIDVVKAFVDTIVSIVGPQLQGSFDNLTKALGDMGITWGDVWEAVKIGIAVTAQIIGAVLIAIVGIIVGFISGISAGINAFTQLIASLVGPFKEMIDGITNIAIGFIGFFKSLFAGDLPAALGYLNVFASGVATALDGLWKSIVASVTGFVNIVYRTLAGFVTGVATFFTDLYNRLVGHSIVPDIVNGIIATFTELVTLGPSVFQDMVDGILSVLDNLVTRAGETVAKISGAITGVLTGGAGVGGAGAGAGAAVGMDQVIAIQTAIATTQAMWDAFMQSMSASFNLVMAGISLQFSMLPDLVNVNLGAVLAAVLMMSDQLNASFAVLAANVAAGFNAMSLAATTNFAVPVGIALALLVSTSTSQMQFMDDYWFEVIKHMVGHWLDFVAEANKLTSEWVNATLAGFDKMHNEGVGKIHDVRNAWRSDSALMGSDTAKLGGQFSTLSGQISGVGSAAHGAANAVWSAAQRMIAAMEAVQAAATGSPELKLQHSFEYFEQYLKGTDFGALISKQVQLPAFMTQVQAVAGGTGSNVTNIDKSQSLQVNAQGVEPTDISNAMLQGARIMEATVKV